MSNHSHMRSSVESREKVVKAALLVFGKFVFSPFYGQPSVCKSQQFSHVYDFLV